MAKSEPTNGEQLGQALASFEAALREAVRSEAARSVDEVIDRLSAGPFRVRDVEFDVVIHNLTLETPSARDRLARPKDVATRRPGGAPRGTGRPPGALRSALVEMFAGARGESLDVETLRTGLAARGVKCTDDNLYQQLRRLVKAGEIARSGRGVYRRDPSRV